MIVIEKVRVSLFNEYRLSASAAKSDNVAAGALLGSMMDRYRDHTGSGICSGLRPIKIIMCLTLTASLPTKPLLAQALPPAESLPPAEDIPEEVLQAEIIMEARSPIDGRPLTAAEYAELQAQLRIAAEDVPGRVTPRLQTLLSLLRIRKLLRPLLPFLIK